MSRKLYDQLTSEKSSLSYADHHHGVTKSEEHSTLKSYGNHHKQRNYGRPCEEDELVKYMSNIPGYLEREKRNREKILNVGVLDWKRLEQWQYSYKHVPHRSSMSSTSTSNTSSVSADRLSGHSSGGHSSCPYGQRIFHPSLQSQFMASPMQGCSQAVKSSRDSVGNCQSSGGSHSNIGTHSKYLDDHLSQKHPNRRLKGCERKYLDPYIDKEHDIFPNDEMYEATSCARLEKSTEDGELEKRVDNLREPDTDTVLQYTPRKSKAVVLCLPRDNPQNNHCRVSDMPKSLVQKAGNSSRTSFSEKPGELSHKDLNYDISHSCPLPDELSFYNHQLKGSGPSYTDLKSIKLPASTFSSPLSVKMGVSPSRSRKAEERKQTIAKTSSANGPLQGLNQKVNSDKSRSSSPFHRFSISTDNTSKGSARKEGEHVPHLSSIADLKYSSENVRGYASSNTSGNDKPGDAGRSGTSPLRRLLDPLLKPKTTKSRHSMESSQKDSVLISNCRSANGNFSTRQLDKEVEKDHRVGCSPVNTIDSPNDKKHVPSMTRALLRIAVRNGLPLFTFAVDDNNSNILTATVKNLSALGKGECNCIYTFFTFTEVKKKNRSWMNQAGRSKGPDYIPHVVAQMKVSDLHYYDLTSQNCVDSSTVKEFVLFSVNLRQGDARATEYQPGDELAAIVVEIPKAISYINGCNQSSCQMDSQDLIHATVLLPSGVHSHPTKGGPSSLIERWRSGGSCDCGGWDLACKLKILANENQACRKPISSKAYFSDQLELFLQGNEQKHQCAFSFTPFKHGVYSIAFDSSLSLLQAFSICIALVDSKMPHELSGSRNSIEDKIPRETLLVQTKELKAFGKLEDIPASYVSYPPLSPFGTSSNILADIVLYFFGFFEDSSHLYVCIHILI